MRSLGVRLVVFSACRLVVACGSEAEPEGEDSLDRCTDNIDNDHDGLVDCEDPRCGIFARCAVDRDAGPDGDADTDADADADTDADADQQCGDDIPVRGELCFGDLRFFQPADVDHAPSGGTFEVGSVADDDRVDVLVAGESVVSLGEDVGLEPPWNASDLDVQWSTVRSMVFANLDDGPADEIAILRASGLVVSFGAPDGPVATGGMEVILEAIVAARLVAGEARLLVGAGDEVVSVQDAPGDAEMSDAGVAPAGAFRFLAAGFVDPDDAEDIVIVHEALAGWGVTVLLSDGFGGLVTGASRDLAFPVQGLAVGDVAGDDAEEIVLVSDGSRSVRVLDLEDGELPMDSFEVGVAVHMMGVMQLDGTGKEEVVVNPVEGIQDPFVEIWDASVPELRLALQIAGTDGVEFIDPPRAWPQEEGGHYVPPHLWILPRRDPAGAAGPEWPFYTAFWPPDP